jgi:hypothetical protein
LSDLLLSDPDVGPNAWTGVIVCTPPHSTHFEIGRMLIDEGTTAIYEEEAGGTGGGAGTGLTTEPS